MSRILLILCALSTLGACAYQWSETSSSGARLADVEPVCREQARQSALRQLPFPFDYSAGPAGFPPDSRRDIENRETARCLEVNGFVLSRKPD